MAEMKAPSKFLDKQRIVELLAVKKEGVLCLTDGQSAYGIPIPPLLYHNDTFYFGMNPSGRKYEYLKKCKNVCYTIFHYFKKPGDPQKMEGWWSIILDGELFQITDPKEIKQAVEMIYEQEDIAPGLREKKDEVLAVVLKNPEHSNFFKMKITHFGGKELLNFIPGEEIKE
jgi:nitroimidazol reductase NimA-like FMN-containing flavoprotein (pyridoxamine 5'-phosphate oxidase superfamily)